MNAIQKNNESKGIRCWYLRYPVLWLMCAGFWIFILKIISFIICFNCSIFHQLSRFLSWNERISKAQGRSGCVFSYLGALARSSPEARQVGLRAMRWGEWPIACIFYKAACLAYLKIQGLDRAGWSISQPWFFGTFSLRKKYRKPTSRTKGIEFRHRQLFCKSRSEKLVNETCFWHRIRFTCR